MRGVPFQVDENMLASPPHSLDGLTGQTVIQLFHGWGGQGARPQDIRALDGLTGQGGAQGTHNGFNFGQFGQGLLVEHGAHAAAFVCAQDDFTQ